MRIKHLLPVLATLFTISCTQSTITHHYEAVSDEGWSRNDTLHFPLPEIKEDGNYRVELGLRYNNLFPYEGLWLVAETRLNTPHFIRIDTLCIVTANKEGRPTGRGVVLMQSDTLLTTLHLSKGQNGEIYLRHIMHNEVFPGILDVGVKVKR